MEATPESAEPDQTPKIWNASDYTNWNVDEVAPQHRRMATAVVTAMRWTTEAADLLDNLEAEDPLAGLSTVVCTALESLLVLADCVRMDSRSPLAAGLVSV